MLVVDVLDLKRMKILADVSHCVVKLKVHENL
jgi:hypothetical protein